MAFSTREVLRYQRHLRLDGFGEGAQQRLKEARVCLIGAGGLGCPIGLYLAAAGVGHLRVYDGDQVELGNLQRQVAHHSSQVGRNKAESLAERMREINPDIHVEHYDWHVDENNINETLQDGDLVIDGSDNFPTRYLISDACHHRGLVYVYGAIEQFEGQVSLFDSRNGPCYRCLFPAPPDVGAVPNCSQAGVLGVLPGTVGLAMATESIKFLAGLGRILVGRVGVYDALEPSFRTINLNKDPACVLCGSGQMAPRVEPETAQDDPEVDAEDARRLNEKGARFLDIRDDVEVQICRIEGAIHIPLDELTGLAMERLDPQSHWLVYCYDGVRSYHAAKILRALGFERVQSLRGGIKDWAERVEPDMARY